MEDIARKYARRARHAGETPQGSHIVCNAAGVPTIIATSDHQKPRFAFDEPFFRKFRWPKRGVFTISMEDVADEDGILSYNCSRGFEDRVALIPDNHSHRDYFYIPRYPPDPPIDFLRRRPKAIFVGSTTGTRANVAKTLSQSQAIDFYFTQVVHMTDDHLRDIIGQPAYEKTVVPYFIPLDSQLRYRYIYSIDGNASSWDRPPWIMKSKSLLLKDRTNYSLWYDEKLQDRVHFMEAPYQELDKVVNYCNANPSICTDIISNANEFARTYCTPAATHAYMAAFCQELVELHEP